MAAGKEPEWTVIYETPSPIDAGLVRTTVEVAGYRVWVEGGNSPAVFSPSESPAVFSPTDNASGALTVSVPVEDAEDARDYLKQKTSLLPHDSAAPASEETDPQ